MRIPFRWIAGLAIAGLLPAEAAGQEPLALEIARLVEIQARSSRLWPGFDPLSIPLAIYDGERTWMFRHPGAPDGFEKAAAHGAMVHPGRHPAVTANSSAPIGEVPTATLLADATSSRQPAALAATAIHEAFHVFQRARHPGWQGNEADLFRYPTDDANLLALRRAESAALARALASTGTVTRACWTRTALDYRDRRFAALDSAFARYERQTELNEGLATYQQLIAAGRTTVTIPAAEFAAGAIRDRVYTIGPALAFLLDAFDPGWQARLESDDRQWLDRMLGAALERAPMAASQGCDFTLAEQNAMAAQAAADAGAESQLRADRLASFHRRDGWRVIIRAAPGDPLWPQGFDPLNVLPVPDGLLHARFLKVGNGHGEIRMVDDAGADLEALTRPAGAHPLFNGLKEVVVAGLDRPEVLPEGQGARIRARGFDATLPRAKVRVEERVVVVELGGTQ